MGKSNLWILMLGLLFCSVQCTGNEKKISNPQEKFAPRTYICERAEGRIVIDGVLSEGSWQKALPSGGFLKMSDNGQPMTNYTEVKMCWDDSNLYVAFIVYDPDIYARKTENDGPLWEEEVVEIFIDEDGDGKEYLEYEINPLNTYIDLRIDQPRPNGDVQPWQPKALFNAEGIRRAVKVYGTVDNRSEIDEQKFAEARIPWLTTSVTFYNNVKNDLDEKWIAEIAIPFNKTNFPFAKNLPPKDKDLWRVNMFRIDRPLKEVGPEEFGSWSPTPTWHMPQYFGKLVFSEKVVGK